MKQEEITQNGLTYLLNEYNIEDYGRAEFVSNPKLSDGSFRRVRSMMPFALIDKTACDFDWNIYNGEDITTQKQIVNAFILNFAKFRENGKGLYIYSKTKGSGKTLLACCLENEISNRHNISIKFINILEFLEMTKKGYTNASTKEDIAAITNSGLLVIDDLGCELSKEWVDTTLYSLINSRYNAKLVTVITSNLKIEDMKMDERIKDRIQSMCIAVHIPEQSIRTRIAQAENENFLKDII